MGKGEDKITASNAVMMGFPFDLKSLTSTNACLFWTKKNNGLKNQYGILGIFISSNLCIRHMLYNLNDAKNLSYWMIYVPQSLIKYLDMRALLIWINK